MMSYFFRILHFSLLKFSFQLHDYTRSWGNSNSSDVLKNAGRRLGIVDMAGKMGKRKAMACAIAFQKNTFNFHLQLRQVLRLHHRWMGHLQQIFHSHNQRLFLPSRYTHEQRSHHILHLLQLLLNWLES